MNDQQSRSFFRKLTLGVGVVVLGSVIVWRYGIITSSDEIFARPQPLQKNVSLEENESLRSSLNEMKQEMDSLRAQLDRIDQKQQTFTQDVKQKVSKEVLSDVQGTTESDVIKREEAWPVSLEEQTARSEAQVRAQLELLASTLSAEKTDSAWANQAQLSITNGLHNAQVEGVQLRTVECRTTLCRIDLLLDGSQAAEGSFQRLALITPWQGQSFSRIDYEKGSAEVYLTRDGYELPQVTE